MKQVDQRDQVSHKHHAFDRFEPRWFNAEALERVAAEFAKGPFDEVDWQVTDERGTHRSASLKALLEQVPIANIRAFEARATQTVRTEEPHVLHFASVSVYSPGAYVSWSADDLTDVEGSRLTQRRVLDYIQTLPKSRRHGESKFGSPPPSVASRLKRPPESVREWLQMGAAIVVVGGVVLAVILKLAGTF